MLSDHEKEAVISASSEITPRSQELSSAVGKDYSAALEKIDEVLGFNENVDFDTRYGVKPDSLILDLFGADNFKKSETFDTDLVWASAEICRTAVQISKGDLESAHQNPDLAACVNFVKSPHKKVFEPVQDSHFPPEVTSMVRKNMVVLRHPLERAATYSDSPIESLPGLGIVTNAEITDITYEVTDMPVPETGSTNREQISVTEQVNLVNEALPLSADALKMLAAVTGTESLEDFDSASLLKVLKSYHGEDAVNAVLKNATSANNASPANSTRQLSMKITTADGNDTYVCADPNRKTHQNPLIYIKKSDGTVSTMEMTRDSFEVDVL